MEELNNTSASILESLISSDPLRAFDQVLCKIQGKGENSKKQEKYRVLVLRCILSLAGQLEVNEEDLDQNLLSVLGSIEGYENRRAISVCLLRLIAEPGAKWIQENQFRPRVIESIDEQFAVDLYSENKIDIKLQTHEKINKLQELIRLQEQEFLKALQMLSDLDRLGTHRNRLMRILNNRTGKILTQSFLPDNIDIRLSDLYKKVENYIQRRDDPGVLEAYNLSVQEVLQLKQTLEEYGTAYSLQIEEFICTGLLKILGQDFANNKAAQPSKVMIEVTDKKYPFHLVGETVNLGFTIRNQGPGYSYNTSIIAIGEDNVRLGVEEIDIGKLLPSTSQFVEISAVVTEACENTSILLQTQWCNFDGEQNSSDLLVHVRAQRADIDWKQLLQSDPYSLEPVTSEQNLAGRREVLNKLIATAKASSVGSSIIYGQKRVGKTSIAKALQSHLIRLGYIVVYLEGGDYVNPTAMATIERLGLKLCEKIKEMEPRVAHVEVPHFDAALATFTDFIDTFTRIIPDRRVVIILDEFDELPVEVYARGPLGNAFFLSLRSISSRMNAGFVLVGSEKMAHIMDCQGDKLNKWSSVPVDYFTREYDWSDYRELVQAPVAETLEYAEGALIELHNMTAGNPYFTKLICQRIFRIAVNKRDCHITRTEVNKAIDIALGSQETDRNTFAHFWEDGIIDSNEKATEKSIRRRKILIAVSDGLKKQQPVPRSIIVGHQLTKFLSTLDSDLEEFVTRKVLIGDSQDTFFEFKVPLFHKWLSARGVHDIITNFSELDSAAKERLQEEKLKVQYVEIVELVKKWGMYKGQAITEDKVRAWLDQFAEIREQRDMFTLLKNLKFYSNEFVRQKMIEAHGIVRRGLIRHIDTEKRQFKRSDIIVSYLDSPAKSGSQLARLYIDEASIYVDNVVEKNKLVDVLRDKTDVQALVFLDDFVGTGSAVSDYLKDLEAKIATVVRERNIKVVFVAVVAFVLGWKRIEETVEKLSMPVQIHACEILEESEKCFGSSSSTFPDSLQRDGAKKVALGYGRLLEKNCPLGYGDLEMLVVFERGCPNNTLPILWSESSNPKWTPLFKRE